jgi:aspartyl-tRNA(Asn)/glutamyl-tRNA(Gln) amidotransferase subunit A
MSVPCGFASGPKGPLPLGLQLVAPPLGEETIFAAAGAHEGATAWHRRVPPGFET